MFDFETLIETREPQVKFKCEIEEGNIEYKLRLDLKNNFGLVKMKNQMSWRFEEGKNITQRRECHYVLGIYDNGKLGKLTESEIEKTLKIFENIIEKCSATIIFLEKKCYNNSWVSFISLLQLFDKQITEINVGFVGASQCGKTTTISNIVYGVLDDGNGSARQNIFRHEHEKNSGYTSCIKKEIIGIKNNNIINYNSDINTTWESIAEISDRIICLIDLPGSQQYTKTILFGLSAYKFDALVIYNSKYNLESNKFNKLYIEYANILQIPYIIVEIDDMYSPSSYVKHKNNFDFKNLMLEEDNFIASEHTNSQHKKNITYTISNIKPNGIKCINTFLTKIDKKKYTLNNEEIQNNIFTITDVVSIPDTGYVYSGEMTYGNFKTSDIIHLTNGNITFKSSIQSIHKKQTFSNNLLCGEMGAIMLSDNNIEIQKYGKNMIISTNQMQSYSQIIFETKSNINIVKNCDIILYINNIICNGTVKDIINENREENNIKYVVNLKKNIVVVNHIENYGFGKISNNIFIVRILF